MAEQEERGRTGASRYIPLYFSYLEQLSLLTSEQVGALVMALLRFGAYGTEPTFPKDSNVYMAFSFIVDSAKRASERSHTRGVNGGLARASSAEKDAKGRFLPSVNGKRSVESVESVGGAKREKRLFSSDGTPSTSSASSKCPANVQQVSSKTQQVQQTQQTQPYQYQYQNQYQEQYRLSDDVDDVVLKLVENDLAPLLESSTAVALTAKDRGELADAVRRYGQRVVEDGIMIAIDRGARTWDYTIKVIRTQAEQPDRRPELV